jgi:hypothetical protein
MAEAQENSKFLIFTDGEIDFTDERHPDTI